MTINKRKKSSRQRGSMTHGWGAKKKHRGSGNRGGFGLAGTGKRADQKKPSIIQSIGLKKYFGKHGFKIRPMKTKVKAVNLSFIENNVDSLLNKDIVKKNDSFYSIDISKLGCSKLLGAGKITKKFKITAKSFSKQAKNKIEGAGGEAILKE